ncbi:HD-GYP domain-containing protein [Leadbettera azotonutricia]|uniref:Response regulator n=1 Tax=Leadbettera azotonutricia (strain ATCC BAA-888 / DSM 13862 / ZAS-9) TaxID=545695 RepID=F5YDH3_LEAAZ|nr:HD domain-containing phosphohydrolase [Leadbettera azotonutricia]AEF83443.1 response regulator [Leadbettera azotonutricia ZAS-9]
MKQILVVDDNLSSLKQIDAQLAGNYEVSLAKSGESALQICARQRPDLILLDIEMSGMNGFEVMDKLRHNPALSRIPVIFLTGNIDSETEVKGLKSGARDFITKPIEKNILIHRIELHLRFSSYQVQLEYTVSSISDSMAVAFAELIECRDENTGGHVTRTSKYVERLGRELLKMGAFPGELSEEGLELIVRGSPLHDIGKIAVSDRILLKPGKLDDAEFAAMKKHAAMGAEMLFHLHARTPNQRYLQYARMIAASHHEKFNGQGYPAGLKGDDIPLSGRIMAVADVYDALSNDRVYRSRMSHDEVCRIILEGKGSHFDPRVVEAFEVVHNDLEQIT